MTFGDRLKEARELANLTRPQLAEKLGVTKSAISNYENGISSPKEDVMLKVFTALHIEPNYLFQDSFMTTSTEASQFSKAALPALAPDERKLIENYRELNEQGREHIRICMASAQTLFKKVSFELSRVE